MVDLTQVVELMTLAVKLGPWLSGFAAVVCIVILLISRNYFLKIEVGPKGKP